MYIYNVTGEKIENNCCVCVYIFIKMYFGLFEKRTESTAQLNCRKKPVRTEYDP